MKIDGFEEAIEKDKKEKEDLKKTGDLFERHPVFYFFLCAFVFLGSLYFLLYLLGVFGAIGAVL